MKPTSFIPCFILSVGLAAMAGDSTTGVISTVAGNGTQGSSGDGGPATSAQLSGIAAIAVDSAGNIYIADNLANAIRKVSPDGVISTALGASGGLRYPTDIVVDAVGNLYFADLEPDDGWFVRGRVVKMTPAGLISTIGDSIFATDGWPTAVVADSVGNVYIGYATLWDKPSAIYKVSPEGMVSTVCPAPADLPVGLALDFAGNLYISAVSVNAGPSGIWKLDLEGRMRQVFNSSNALGVAVDSKGNLFVSEIAYTSRIWRVTPDGASSIVAGNGTSGFSGDGGPATSAQLNFPASIAIDKEDNLLIGDDKNFRVRKVVLSSPIWKTETFFAHVAVGGGYTTTVTLTNTGDSPISGSLILTDSQGQPLTASVAGAGAGSSFPVFVAPAGTMFLSINPVGPGDPLKCGWATVFTSGGVPNGVATYHLASGGATQAVAGVPPSQPMQYATIPIDDDASQGRVTAYAVANPTSQNLVIKLALVDQDGQVVDDSVTFTLAPKQQIARHVNRDLARPQFKGSMVLRAQEGGSFVAVALRQYQKLFTVVPIISGKASRVPD